jgi:hypothetical protein
MGKLEGDNLAAKIFGEAASNEPETKQNITPAPETGQPEPEAEKPEPEQKPAKKYAGKFDSDEELEKAYLESQKFMTQKAQEAAQYRRQLEQLQQQLQQLQQATALDMTKKQQEEFQAYVKKTINAAVVDEDPTLLLQLIDRLTEEKTEAKIRQIMPVIEPIVRQNILEQHVQEFFAENPEAKELEAEMAKLVQAEPDLVYDAKGNVRPNWPYRVYARLLKQQTAVARKINAEAAAQAAAAKAAAAAPGSTARPGQPQPESEEEKLKKAIFGDGGKRRMFDY